MIPEIYDLFEAIAFLRKRRDVYKEAKEDFVKGSVVSRAFAQKILFCEKEIEHALNEINEIAKERGNSYYDENGHIVWVPSNIKYKEK